MRLIDADALMKEFRDFVRDSNNSDFAPVPTWNDAVSLVGSAPTADVVEVVRCKDCKWWRDSDHTCGEWGGASPRCACDFCSRGERKETEDATN